ncbi:MAG: apolipoprotein N-acyltransferase [Myxococcota bacterium]
MALALPRHRALAAVLVSSLLYALAFRGGAWSALAWVALVPLFLAIRSGSRVRGLALAGLWGLVSGYGIAEPFPGSISQYFQQQAWVGWIIAVGIFGSMASPYYAAFAALDRRLARLGPSPLAPLAVACAWLAVEWVRGRLFTETVFFIGNPWGLLGASQLAALPLVQLSEFTGIYGPSFLVALSNATLAAEIEALRAGSWERRASMRRWACVLLPVLAAALHGSWVLRSAEPRGLRVRVASVQPDVDVGSRWRRDFYGRNLELSLRLSDDVVAESAPALLFWPESSFTFLLEEEPAYARTLARSLAAWDAQLIAGGPARVSGADGEAPAWRNRMFSIDPARGIIGRYDKEHLVPFAEYVPGSMPDPAGWDFEGARSFGHGSLTGPIPSRAGPVGVVICNEALLAEVTADRVRAGAQILANPSNDSWVAEPDFARRMLEHVAFRSIELRRYLVRSSTEGPSAIIDPWGRIQASTRHGESATLVGEVSPRTALTLYARFGDWFPALASAVAGLAALAAGRVRR